MIMASSDEQTKKLSPRKGIQGSTPSPLKVGKNSSKIKKQPLVGPDHVEAADRPPVIIYIKSPEIIHVEAKDFRNVVQRLTGSSSSSSSSLELPSSLPFPSSTDVEVPSTKDMGQDREVDPIAQVDHLDLTHEPCSLGFSIPLPVSTSSSSSSFLPPPDMFQDFVDFDDFPFS